MTIALNEWVEWCRKTLLVLGVCFIFIVVAVSVFGVTIKIPVSYETVAAVIEAEVLDAEISDGPKKLAKK